MATSIEPKATPTIRLQQETKTIAAGEFKAKCLKLLDEVAATGQALVVTKFGKPVAQIVAIPKSETLFGAMKGSVLWEGDIISPLDDAWELSDHTDELFNNAK
jgi:prevent-host-death family protein